MIYTLTEECASIDASHDLYKPLIWNRNSAHVATKAKAQKTCFLSNRKLLTKAQDLKTFYGSARRREALTMRITPTAVLMDLHKGKGLKMALWKHAGAFCMPDATANCGWGTKMGVFRSIFWRGTFLLWTEEAKAVWMWGLSSFCILLTLWET